jgi:UDP-N-acetyl-D-mannosaminuronic acid dehydrogenase
LAALGINPDLLTREITQGKHQICVVGLGHVGLPLALLFASEGASVIGCEREGEYLTMLRRGKSPIVEHSGQRFADEVLEQSCPNCGVRLLRDTSGSFCPNCMRAAETDYGRVRLTGESHVIRDRKGVENEIQLLLSQTVANGKLRLASGVSQAVGESDIVVICVGTPIDKRRKPDLTALVIASKEIGRGLKAGTIVIVKSTVPPGTTEEIVAPTLERESGLKAGRDFGLAHVPETTLEGLALLGYRTLPKTIGGVDRRSSESAAAVFKVFNTPIFVFESPRITEAAKLFQNIYRDVNVALANELALASESLNLDITRVIEAALTEPKTHILTPGPGVGGYCLPKDTYYLTSSAERKGYRPRILLTARRVNDGMPRHVVALLKSGYKEAKTRMAMSRVAVLGVSFKANTADTRESPSFEVIRSLQKMKMKVSVHDPLADVESLPQLGTVELKSHEIGRVLEGAESLILITDHLDYRNATGLYLRKLAPSLKVVVDTRHVFSPDEIKASGLVYRGVGQR